MRDDSFSQRGSKTKKGAIIFKEGRFPAAKDVALDEVYNLEAGGAIPADTCCHFCKRTLDSVDMLGPFFKGAPSRAIIDSS